MGQAKRRKQQLGSLYGTPEGSNRRLIAYSGFAQGELDQKALVQIRKAQAAGQHVILFGTKSARPLAEAAGLSWLHEIPAGDPIPRSVAWDLEIAESGGPMLPAGHGDGATAVLAAGTAQWMATALGAA